ncbi:hypothetical protein [Glycomyces sp. YM15]|uniref:hypothetical protein n=1 Tax=Glycomyces sp. YM15 TaxID=2800446 RepID=UPI001965DDC6|nr:hypothetical protein [Glycomyces sp. YM15]
MTTIFEVLTWGREGTKVDGRLTRRLGDDTRFPRGAAFGLQLLMDAWFQGFGTMALDPGTAKEFEECFELFLGKQVWTDDEGHLLDPATKELVRPKVKAIEHFGDRLDGSNGRSGGYRYLVLKPQNEEFHRRAAAIIASFAIEAEPGGDKARFTVEATDPKYVAHMEEHCYFQTAFTGGLPT